MKIFFFLYFIIIIFFLFTCVQFWLNLIGILIYEMLAGYPPFFDDNPFGIYEKILAGKIDWPRHMDPIAKDLVKKLLVQDRTKRLGNMKVKRIKFFRNEKKNEKKIEWRHSEWSGWCQTPPVVQGTRLGWSFLPETQGK